MRSLKWLLVCAAGLAMALPAWATIDTVVVQSNQFVPAHISIAHGDTVVWHCISGFHNVHHLGTPSLFGNSAAAAPWFYTFAFDTVGDSTFHYECQIHGPAMQGSVTVGESSAPERPSAGNTSGFSLFPNYPNPFNNQTTIEFSVPIESDVRIAVLDVLGQTVRQLFGGRVSAGAHRVVFDASGLSSGLYFYSLEAPGAMIVRKMNYVK